MACENLTNKYYVMVMKFSGYLPLHEDTSAFDFGYYVMVMKFSGYLPLHEDTSAFDFGPDRSIPLAGHAP